MRTGALGSLAARAFSEFSSGAAPATVKMEASFSHSRRDIGSWHMGTLRFLL
jgi:hypothetical protein